MRAMSMSLKIIGTMGISSETPVVNSNIYIDGDNTRGARIILDFTDCVVPTAELKNYFLRGIINFAVKMLYGVSDSILKAEKRLTKRFGAINILKSFELAYR